MVEPFPPIRLKRKLRSEEDANPAIQLFGRRFYADQSVAEFLVELLLVMSSTKRIGDSEIPESSVFPERDLLCAWPDGKPLEYEAKARLNLKLFSFLGASKLETRHESHRQHYRELLQELRDRLVISSGSTRVDAEDVLRTLENLFLGFQGVGAQRTWCAQAFVPVCREVLGAETIWNNTQAARDSVEDWSEVLDGFLRYFSLGRHRFLARGGEVLFLQLCNALRQDSETVDRWLVCSGLSPSEEERDPRKLHVALSKAFEGVLSACPDTVGRLADFIDRALDPETSGVTDTYRGRPRDSDCGWCPSESWPEGYLFAVDLLRLCEAQLDPIDRLELLSTACAMQVLRSLCAQSARYVPGGDGRRAKRGTLGFIWAVSDPEGQHPIVKQISRRCVKENQRLIHDAIRHPEILEVVEEQEKRHKRQGKHWKEPYGGPNGADSRYGHKLFLSLAKRIGFIVPKRGPGARFIVNDRLLQYLVMTVVRPGKRVTYDTFKAQLYARHGIAVDDGGLGDACEWCGTSRLDTFGGDADAWVVRTLDASGMLIRLSDSCSLVRNPFGGGG